METPTTETPAEAPIETPETTSYSLLAQKEFKQGYVGEAQEVTEDSPEVTEEVEETLETDEIIPEVESEEESEEEVISSFDDLVTTQEWERDWVDSLTLKTKVDGEERPVKLSEMKASYQTMQAAEKRLEEAKAVKESAKAEVAQQNEAAKQQLVIATSIVAEAEKALQGEFDNTNFKELEKVDPGEAALKRMQYQEKRQNLDALKNKALSEYQNAVSQNHEKAQQALSERLQQESEMLIEKIPEWSNEDTAQVEKANVGKYLSSVGFADNEIAQAYDHRMILLARKAMLYDEGEKKLEPAKQKLKVVKKTIPPGSRKSPTQIHTKRKKELRENLQKSGSLEDAFRLYRGS